MTKFNDGVAVTTGPRGRFRWALYKDGKAIALCPVRGFSTSAEAYTAASDAARELSYWQFRTRSAETTPTMPEDAL